MVTYNANYLFWIIFNINFSSTIRGFIKMASFFQICHNRRIEFFGS
nr:MAG TPA: hypothetical protein [Crassvirales sp.]